MKQKILLADPLLKKYLFLYQKYFEVDTLWSKKKLNYNEYEGLVVSGLFKIPSNLYNKMSKLKIISDNYTFSSQPFWQKLFHKPGCWNLRGFEIKRQAEQLIQVILT